MTQRPDETDRQYIARLEDELHSTAQERDEQAAVCAYWRARALAAEAEVMRLRLLARGAHLVSSAPFVAPTERETRARLAAAEWDRTHPAALDALLGL